MFSSSLRRTLTKACSSCPLVFNSRPTAISIRPISSSSSHFHSSSATAQASPASSTAPYVQDGHIRLSSELTFSPVHLRDHCRCERCFHPITHQRLLDTFSIPQDIEPLDISSDSKGIHVTWSDNSHRSFYPHHFLESIAPPLSQRPRTTDTCRSIIPPSKSPWHEPTRSKLPSFTHSSFFPSDALPSATPSSRSTVLEALTALEKHGVIFIDGVEPTPEATEKLSRLFANGKLRNTHYDDFWTFSATSLAQHGDLAYSNLALPAHTDTSYFTDPCGLQIFHLFSHPCPPGSGGHTLLVDGLACAQQLREVDLDAFETLCRVRTGAHAAGTEGFLYTTGGVGEEGYKGWSVFELGVGGCVDSVRWNNEDRSLGFRGPSGEPATAEEIEGWYRAARVWEGLLRKRGNELWHKLEPGTVVVIDNTRVMHGRSGFVGERKMCGAYVGRDEWVSWKEVLEREEREERPGGGDGDEEKKGERDVWNLGY